MTGYDRLQDNGGRMQADLQDSIQLLWGNDRPSISSQGEAAVHKIQRRYQLVLPHDFAAYLQEASPSSDWSDSRGFIWWTTDRIKSLREECGSDTPAEQRNAEIENEADAYLVFADFLDWCYAYAICCSDGSNRGKVALIGSYPDRFVARSFSAFVNLAATGSDRLHSPAGDHFIDLV